MELEFVCFLWKLQNDRVALPKDCKRTKSSKNMFYADKFVAFYLCRKQYRKRRACNVLQPKYKQAPTPDWPPLVLVLHGGLEYHCPRSKQNFLGLVLVHSALPHTFVKCYPSRFWMTLGMVLQASSSTITSGGSMAGWYLMHSTIKNKYHVSAYETLFI